MRLEPLVVGVLMRRVLRRGKVLVRCSIKAMGSPSPPTLAGKRSISSQTT